MNTLKQSSSYRISSSAKHFIMIIAMSYDTSPAHSKVRAAKDKMQIFKVFKGSKLIVLQWLQRL